MEATRNNPEKNWDQAIAIAKETLPQIDKKEKIPTSYFLETLIEDRHHAFVEFDTELIAELTKKD